MSNSKTDYGSGINIVSSSNVTLNSVTSTDNAAAGLIVNSSTVIALGYDSYKLEDSDITIWSKGTVKNVASIKTDSVTKYYPTIQAAITAAVDGNTVNVAAGTYNIGENKILVDKGIRLIGAGMDVTKIIGTVHRAGSIANNNATVLLQYNTRTVDASYTGVEGKDNKYRTLQAAITAANAGDIINVAAGTYWEDITINKAVTINGTNAGVAYNGTRGAETIIKDSKITVTADGVIIRGIKSDYKYVGWQEGRYMLDAQCSRLTVENCIFANTSENSGGAVYSLINLRGGEVTYYKFTGNMFTDVATTLGVSNVTEHAIIQSNGTKSNVDIQNNLFEISENAFFNSAFSGLIANNRFTTTPSLLSNISSDYFRNISALNSDKLVGVIIENNTFENLKYNVLLLGGSATVRNNTFRNNSNGTWIYMFDSASNISISTNTLDFGNNVAKGIFLSANASSVNVSIHNNKFIDVSNIIFAIKYVGIGNPLNAVNNYWGNAMPDFSRLVIGNVQASPYYANADMTIIKENQSSVLTIDPAIITVHNNGGALYDYVDVVSMAAGDTIKVYELATDGTVIGSNTVASDGKTSVQIINAFGETSGVTWVTVTRGTEESPRVQVYYDAEMTAPTAIILTSEDTLPNDEGGVQNVITWTGSTSPSVVEYVILREKSGISSESIYLPSNDRLGGTDRIYTDTTAIAGETYSYYVQAGNGQQTFTQSQGTEVTTVTDSVQSVGQNAAPTAAISTVATEIAAILEETPVAEQGVPTEVLTALGPTTVDNNDGKITGVTTAMEYKLSTAEEFIKVTAEEIASLASGTYQVRYAAKEGFNAGATAEVVIPAYMAPTV